MPEQPKESRASLEAGGAHYADQLTQLPQEELEKLREREVPIWIIIVGSVFIAAAVVHAYRTRAIDDILVQSRPVMIALGVVMLLIATVVLFADPPRVTLAKAVQAIIPVLIILAAMAVAAVVLGAIFYSVGVSVHDIYLWIRSDMSGPPQTSSLRLVMVVALPLAAGALLFWFRLRFRAIYGLSEAAVGLWMGGRMIGGSTTTSASVEFILPILTASVYLMVRGFDNVYQGLSLKSDPKDPMATTAIEWLRKPWRP